MGLRAIVRQMKQGVSKKNVDEMKDYKRITVQDIIDYIKSEPEKFPDGMKTVIVSGDFECNYTHEKHVWDSQTE